MNCFLIDDDPDDQEIFRMALDDIGESVKCSYANSGSEALKKLEDVSFVPDVIFIDVNMPGMSGNDCLTEIKKIDRMKTVPVYMYSTVADPDAVSETQRLGAAGFIIKPASVAELTTTLKFCLKPQQQ